MDSSYNDRVERSQRMTLEERFYGTLEMIDLSRELMLAGIRMQFPSADDAQVREIFTERLRIVERMEQRQ
jgi:hypothetical protein